MGRRKRAVHRTVLPDPIYDDLVVAKFLNRLMLRGKKGVSEGIFYGALEVIKQRNLGKDALEVFKRAVDNVKPFVEVRSRRVGGATYQVPMEVRPERRQALAIRWLIAYAQERNGKSMAENLSNEILDAFHGTGGAMKKKEDVHRMAEANKAFSHYRW